ncbi:SLBB domain-containing protein [Luteolibacter pohnpeiensis]|uniref:SLBB domain-containing protein n=1 Tax=Luteolibacter pohnpeiensis TaxID=454153 RepID=A0A934S544_9BACT|nr:SLBB domain-containing protein [Luteolibacter pohnpeiensis]MBK1881324.1 SLBB domain-containing protein [Luteolibacter pohnpeiensis]
MNIIYPIQSVLVYLAMCFSSQNVDRITVKGPNIEAVELVRDGDVWKNSDGSRFLIENGQLEISRESGNEVLPIHEFIPELKDHNWVDAPTVSMMDGTLSKDEDGFTFKIKVAGGDQIDTYSINYKASAPKQELAALGEIRINVLGAVRVPGVYKVAGNGSLIDAIATAGGFGEKANSKKVSIVRGPAGEIPNVTYFNVESMLDGKNPAPALKERDTIYVYERIF